MKYIPVFKRDSSMENKTGSIEVILLVGAMIVALGAATVYSLNPKRWDKEITLLFNPAPAPQVSMPVNTTPSPALKPSERALKAAAWLVSHTPEDQLSKAMNNNPNLGSSPAEVVKNMATFYDSNPERLALFEAEIEKYNHEQQKSAKQQTIIYKQAPSIFSSIHCTTNTAGSFTYTNCY